MTVKPALTIFVMTLALSACGDDDRNTNPNNISILDVGTVDAGSDATADAAVDDADMTAEDVGSDTGAMTFFITVAPVRPYVSLQQTTPLVATLKIDNVVIPDAIFEWESETPDIATVDQNGVVTGVSAGEAAIVARVGDTFRRAAVAVYSVHRTVATGAAHTCTAKVDGRVTCFGANDFMQAGREDLTDAPTAQEVIIRGDQAVQNIYAGINHSCATTDMGNAMCWGNNQSNQLGPLAMESPQAVPSQVAFGAPVGQMALGEDFSCALLESGVLRCWGGNNDKVINASADAVVAQPTRVQPTVTFREIAAGRAHMCGLTDTFNLFCWGDNSANQLGDNAVGNGGHDLVRISNTQYTAVAAYGDQTCAYSLFRGLQCWGSSEGGFGDLALISTPTPTSVPLADPNFQRMSVGASHVCVVVADITYCWGKNDKGQLGDNTVDDRALPVPVLGSPNFEHLSCGEEHCCAIGTRGGVFCWGENSSGQLGDGSGSPQRLPVAAPPTAF